MHTLNRILVVVAILASDLFLAGCTKDGTPIVAPSKMVSTAILPTAPEGSKHTATLEAEMPEGTPHVSPYIQVMVVDVEFRFLETDPVQVELVIRGTLPDQCKYGFYSLENRAGQNVKVSLAGIHPADTGCLQTDQNIEYVLLLGQNGPETERGFSPGDYTLTVNNYQTSFSIK